MLTFLQELRREEKNLKRCQLFDDQEELYSIPAQHPVPGLSSSEDIPNSHEPAKMTFRCGFCSRSFDKRFHRNEHEKIKHNVKTDPKHLCTEIGCGKRLSSKGCLNTHLNSVNEHLPYCSASYSQLLGPPKGEVVFM